MLDQYTYIFVIGTFFAMLDAYNNGASKYHARKRSGLRNNTQSILTYSTLFAFLNTDQSSQTMLQMPGPPASPLGLSLTGRP